MAFVLLIKKAKLIPARPALHTGPMVWIVISFKNVAVVLLV